MQRRKVSEIDFDAWRPRRAAPTVRSTGLGAIKYFGTYCRGGSPWPPGVGFYSFDDSLRLDADGEVTDRDLLIRRDLGWFFTRYFFSIDDRRIPTLGHEPVSPFVITRKRCMNAADFRIALDRQIH